MSTRQPAANNATTAVRVPRARKTAVRIALAAAGLACWIVTLTLHSATVTPFQRFAGLGTFVGSFAPQALALAAMAAAAVSIASLRGRRIPKRLLWGVGSALFLTGNVAFAVLSLTAASAVPGAAVTALSFVAGLGSVGTGLSWGRVFRGFGPRLSLAAVGLAGVCAAALGTLVALLPAVPCAAAFIACTAAAAALPPLCGMDAPGANDPAEADRRGIPRSTAERLKSFAGVAAPALIGLLAFAFVVGTMRALVIESHPFHLASLAIDGALLTALAAVHLKRPFAGLAYRSLIPALAVLLLTVTNISMALFGGSWVDMAMIYLLYTLAALLTLATLSAVAHAGEFPSDFVYGMPFSLFCLTSLVGLACAEAMSAEAVKVSTTVITAVYAFAMVIVPWVRNQRLASTEPFLEEESPSHEGLSHAPGNPAAPGSAAPTLEERCAALSETYRLTAREAEILRYLAAGYGSGYISEVLYISPNTVRTHIHNIYGKLGVNAREEVLDLVKSPRP